MKNLFSKLKCILGFHKWANTGIIPTQSPYRSNICKRCGKKQITHSSGLKWRNNKIYYQK